MHTPHEGDRTPGRGSGRRGSRVLLGLAIVAALVFASAGVFYLRVGDGLGWLLLLIALLPLAAAARLHARSRGP